MHGIRRSSSESLAFELNVLLSREAGRMSVQYPTRTSLLLIDLKMSLKIDFVRLLVVGTGLRIRFRICLSRQILPFEKDHLDHMLLKRGKGQKANSQVC